MNEAVDVDLEEKRIKTTEHVFPYDYLILASGSNAFFFDIPGAAEHAFQLKTLEQAIDLRNHILFQFERALCEDDHNQRLQMLTFVVVGGGPTGVEFTGALAELMHGPLAKDFPTLDITKDVRIILLEATDRLLSSLPERLQSYAVRRLRQMGVEVLFQAAVSQVDPNIITLIDGATIPTETVVWTAGVRGEASPQAEGLWRARNGRIHVQPTLQVAGHPEVYVIGDLANLEVNGNALPMVAPVAVQQADLAARNILRQMRGQDPIPFQYRDPGTMVTLGRNSAVVNLGGHAFVGFIAWVMWVGVHLFKLINFRNRLLVIINWAWDYLFFERVVRLIIPLPKKKS
jgi:NADH:ubiquinone reductase (H+-translocating)